MLHPVDTYTSKLIKQTRAGKIHTDACSAHTSKLLAWRKRRLIKNLMQQQLKSTHTYPDLLSSIPPSSLWLFPASPAVSAHHSP